MANRILISRGTAPIKLAKGKAVKVLAQKDQAYQVIDLSAPPGNAPADPAKLAKEGGDLVVRYPDGTQFTLGGFFTVCPGNACTVTLADGTPTGQVVSAGAIAAAEPGGMGFWGWAGIIGGAGAVAALAIQPKDPEAAPTVNVTIVMLDGKIVMQFTDTVLPGTGDLVVRNEAGTDTRTIDVTGPEVTFSGSTVTVDPAVDLQSNTNYTVEINPGVITDSSGNELPGVTTDTSIPFQTADASAPTLVSSTPGNGVSAVAVGSNITLTFSETVQPGTTGVIVITDGVGAAGDNRVIPITDAAQVSVSGNTVTINPTANLLPNRTYYVAVSYGAIRDLGGNAFAGIPETAPLTFLTTDTLPPTLSSAVPTDNATAVLIGSNIVLTFSEAMQAGSGNIVISNGAGDTRTISVTDASQVTISGSTVTINPTANLQGSSTYNVQMASGVLRDAAGNAYAGISNASALNFDTQDLSAPTLSSSTPADNATAVLLGSNIVLTFNETVQAGTGNIVISNGAGDTRTISVTDATQVTISGSTVTINPTADLLGNSTYNVQMASGVIRDVAGTAFAGISGATTLNFDTQDLVAPTMSSSTPADNATAILIGSNIVLTFSETVQAGTGNIVISNGAGDTRTIGVLDASQVTISGNTVTINPTASLLGNSTYNVQMVSDVIRDAAGNAFAGISGTTALNFDTQDLTAPTLTGSTPVASATAVLLGSNIVLTFSETVQAGSGDIVISNGAGDTRNISVTDATQVSISGNTVTINPTADLLGSSAYSVQMVSGVIRDAAGNAFAGSSGEVFFSTQDVQAPALVSAAPNDGEAEVNPYIMWIDLQFDEAVQAGTGNIVITNGTDTRLFDVTDAARVVFSGNSISVRPDTFLQPGTHYEVLISSGVITDAAGNSFAGLISGELDFDTSGVGLDAVAAGSGGFVVNGGFGGGVGEEFTFVGDVNGDGRDDIAVQFTPTIATGAIAVVFGKDDTTAVSLDDVWNGVGGFVIENFSEQELNYSIAALGDVNGDGLADLLIGEPSSFSGQGRSYVVYGKADANTVALTNVATGAGGWVINGYGESLDSGYDVAAAGDVNGDGFGDLIVGARHSDPAGVTDAGRSYIVFGGGNSAVDLSNIDAGFSGRGFAINGEAVGDRSGWSVSAAGDVNGDGLADVIIGAPTADSLNGRSYVVFGSSVAGAVELSDIAAGVGGFVVNGVATNQNMGNAVAQAGDVNGDGLADVLIAGAFENYLVFGKSDGAAVELSALQSASAGFAIAGGAGGSVAGIGDVNGDGLADILVGTSVESYVIFGKTDASPVNSFQGAGVLQMFPGSGITGPLRVSGAGDVNGDGLADLLVGAADGDPAGNPDAGQVYVIFGATGGAFGAATLVDQYGTAGTDFISSGFAGSRMVAGAGDDFVEAFGDSVAYLGAGNDFVYIDGQMRTALVLPAGVFGLARIDGGSGIDTLALDASASADTLDLTQIANAGAGTPQAGGRIESIEVIDITGYVDGGNPQLNGNNTLVLSAQDIVDMSGTPDSRFFVDFPAQYQLIVDGDAGDSVEVAGEWRYVGNLNPDGFNEYGIYESVTAEGIPGFAQLVVDSDITVKGAVPISLWDDVFFNSFGGIGGFIISGGFLGETSGWSVSSAGDVNGDGLADVVVGAPESDPLAGAGAGRSYVVFGKTGTAIVSLAPDVIGGIGGFVVNGQSAGDISGVSVSGAGDVNGDGLDDLLIGANRSDPVAGADAGRSYLVFGKTSTAEVDLSAVSAGVGGFVINGGTASNQSGRSVSGAGDVNGDGLADLIVAGLGRSYLVFGKASTSEVDLSAVLSGVGGFVINEQVNGDESGWSVSGAGDVNGDGLADLIVGAPQSDPAAGTSAGRSYLVFGKSTTTAVDLSAVAAGTGGFVISGRSDSEMSGWSVSDAGDVNGDGLADLIVGAPQSMGAGTSYVVFGQTSTSEVLLAGIAVGVGGFVINPHSAFEQSGYSVSSAGDINGDGLADLIVGAPYSSHVAGSGAGRSYVVFGKTTTESTDLSAVAAGSGGFMINGDFFGTEAGLSVSAAGDVNGDGLADLLVGAPDQMSGAGGAGQSFIIFGNTAGAFSQTFVDQYGTAGDDTFSDGGTAQTLVTGQGNDTLTATAASILYAGAGDDVMNIDTTMITALQSAMGTGGNIDRLSRIDGGTGIDTLALSGANLTLDLAQIANQAASNIDGGSRIDSIERIDLTGTGNNTLVLQLRDVLDMGSANTFEVTGRQQLLVTGNALDRLDLADAFSTNNWTQSGTASIDSVTYNIWNHNTALATVYVNTAITVM